MNGKSDVPAASVAPPVARFSRVVKRYGSTLAVDGVSLDIRPGEFFALLGPNGAGKTTLVRTLLDFVRPDEGTVEIQGVPARSPAARSRLGFLPEKFRMPGHLSPRQLLLRKSAMLGMSRREAADPVAQGLESAGLRGKEDAPAATLSKGLLQRVGIAAALLCRPSLLVLDEPTSGLDPIGVRDIRELLEGLRSSGVAMLLNSHYLSEVEKLCDRAAVLNRGRLVAQAGIGELTERGISLEDFFVDAVRGNGGGGAGHA